MRDALPLFVLSMTVAFTAYAQLIPTNVPPVKLFDELNYDLPGLAKVKAAVDSGDTAAATVALLDHFRSRPDVRRPQPNAAFNRHLAHNILLRGMHSANSVR